MRHLLEPAGSFKAPSRVHSPSCHCRHLTTHGSLEALRPGTLPAHRFVEMNYKNRRHGLSSTFSNFFAGSSLERCILREKGLGRTFERGVFPRKITGSPEAPCAAERMYLAVLSSGSMPRRSQVRPRGRDPPAHRPSAAPSSGRDRPCRRQAPWGSPSRSPQGSSAVSTILSPRISGAEKRPRIVGKVAHQPPAAVRRHHEAAGEHRLQQHRSCALQAVLYAHGRGHRKIQRVRVPLVVAAEP